MPRTSRSLVALAVAVATALTLGACAGSGAIASAPGKPVVLTTFTVLADIARNVAGDDLTVESITKDGAEIHDYEPTPQDVAKASRADLVLDNGLGLETWFTKFIQSAHVPHVVVSKGVHTIPIASGAKEGAANPHAWMSPLDVERYVDNMVPAFTKLAPEHKADFEANAERYKSQLQQIQQSMVKDLDAVPEQQRVLVTCEGAFSYLAKDTGMHEDYIWPVNSEDEGTAQQIAALIDRVKTDHVPAVFCESTVSLKAMQQVEDATGARFGGTLYVDSLSAKGGPVPTYLDLIRHDATAIIDGLTEPS